MTGIEFWRTWIKGNMLLYAVLSMIGVWFTFWLGYACLEGEELLSKWWHVPFMLTLIVLGFGSFIGFMASITDLEKWWKEISNKDKREMRKRGWR